MLANGLLAMSVLTIAGDLGIEAEEIGRKVADAAGMAYVDASALLELGKQLHPEITVADEVEALERRIGGQLTKLALGLAISAGAWPATRELEFRAAMPDLAREVALRAAESPAVIQASAAFAALGDRRGAIHVRLWAPRAWRVEQHHRSAMIDRATAEEAVRADDHLQRTWVRSLYGVDLDDLHRFMLSFDVSRIHRDRIVASLVGLVGA